MTEKLVIALISGGKDSLLALHHAQANGYTIVALANLHPPLPSSSSPTTTVFHPDSALPTPTSSADASDELDSYMYQTIGHTLLPLYSRCLDLPQYRRPITGSHANDELNYAPNKTGDETEDLHALLADIVEAHPGVTAVTSGAILSTYQRTRVESVCARLGLTSLAYLWRKPQIDVLTELGELGVDARIVKTAALGLDERWLWQSVAAPDTVQKLQALERKWGVNVAGEGGEYETVVISAPAWKGEIVVDESERVVRKDGDAVWLEFTGASVREKEVRETKLSEKSIFESEFQELLDELSALSLPAVGTPTPIAPQLPAASTVVTDTTVQVLNLTAPASPTPEAELSAIFTTLKRTLEDHNLLLTSILHLHLHLRDLNLFVPLNKLYSTYFTAPLPPSRVTVSTPLPEAVSIMLSATASRTPATGLHVQSISYWAPCNIGPYSQSKTGGNGWVETAGMIPLIPASMEVQKGRVEQAVLALQHVKRVWEAVGAEGVGAICWVAEEGMVPVIAEVWRRWGNGGLVVCWAEGLPRGVGVEWEGIGRQVGREGDDAEWEVEFGDGEKTVCGETGKEVVLFGALEGKVEVGEGVRIVPTRGVWDAEGKRWEWAVAKRSGM